MAYTRGIPASGQSISLWQKQQRNNSFVLDDVFGREHYPYSDPEDGGKHRMMRFPVQPGDATTLSDEVSLYTKLSGVHSIFVRPDSNGVASAIIDEDTFGTVQRTGDFVLGASCLFDFNGKVFNSYNVINITYTEPNPAVSRTYTINLTQQPTANYFWTMDYFNSSSDIAPGFEGIYPAPSALYSDSFTDQKATFTIFNTLAGATVKRNKFSFKIWLIA